MSHARVLVGMMALLAVGCEHPSLRARRPGSAPLVSDIDPAQIGDAARFLAGLSGRNGGAYRALESSAAWRAYRTAFDRTWARVSERQLDAVSAFERRELAGDRAASRFVFYPFSGPDVLYLTRFFPGRDVYVMAGLERIGHLPRPGEYTQANIDAHLAAWSGALDSIFRRSFFITSEMSRQFHGDVSDGLLPMIALLLARGGYTVDAIRFGQIQEDGTWGLPGAARPRAVRLDFHAGRGAEQTLYYLSTDLAAGFGERSRLAAFLNRLGRPETFIKSASFLPHRREFRGLREYILRASTRIVQDDTGVPYQVLLDSGWLVELYGQYSAPDKSFRGRFQPALAEAYGDNHPEEPLGFSIGYGFQRRPSSLMVARRARR